MGSRWCRTGSWYHDELVALLKKNFPLLRISGQGEALLLDEDLLGVKGTASLGVLLKMDIKL